MKHWKCTFVNYLKHLVQSRNFRWNEKEFKQKHYTYSSERFLNSQVNIAKGISPHGFSNIGPKFLGPQVCHFASLLRTHSGIPHTFRWGPSLWTHPQISPYLLSSPVSYCSTYTPYLPSTPNYHWLFKCASTLSSCLMNTPAPLVCWDSAEHHLFQAVFLCNPTLPPHSKT